MSKTWLAFLVAWTIYVAVIAPPLWSILLAGGILLTVTLTDMRTRGRR